MLPEGEDLIYVFAKKYVYLIQCFLEVSSDSESFDPKYEKICVCECKIFHFIFATAETR